MSLEGNVWNKLNSAWRELKDSATIAWNFGTNHEASVSLVAGSVGTTQLTDDNVTNGKLANMAESTIKGRAAGAGAGDPTDLTATQATAILNNFVGDSGSGGTKGLVPAPSAGDAAAGKFLAAGGLWTAPTSGATLLESGTVTSAATIDIELTSYTGYRGIKIILYGLVPANDDVELWMRFSTDGGSNYDAGASDYAWGNAVNTAGTGGAFQGDAADSEISICGAPSAGFAVGNDAAEGIYVELTLLGQTSTASKSRAMWQSCWIDPSNRLVMAPGSGSRLTAQDTNAVRVLPESGDIASAGYAVYGLI